MQRTSKGAGRIAQCTRQQHAGANDYTRSSGISTASGPSEDGAERPTNHAADGGVGVLPAKKESGRAGRRSGTGRCAERGNRPGRRRNATEVTTGAAAAVAEKSRIDAATTPAAAGSAEFG